jgi:hypothetical protein
MKAISLIAFIASMMCSLAGAAQVEDCALSARIVPAKEVYLFQEPIRLDVTLFNRGSASASVVLAFPYLNGQLSLTDKHHNLRRREEYSPERVGFGGKAVPRVILPGQSWQFSVFLQTYYANPEHADYEMSYTMVIPCLVEGRGLISRTSSGTLSVRVQPADSERLRRIVQDYAAKSGSGDPLALEALLSMDNPIVIPEMKRILDGSNFERALQTLSRFRENPLAEEMVRETVHSPIPARQIAGLNVMSQWRKDFSESELSLLLRSPSRDVRSATLRYLQALDDPKFLQLISPLLTDPDQEVANEARKTEQILRGNAQ